jgi:hypothetical protein
MSTIVLRSVKGTPLTNTEVDSNFTNLNTDKYQSGDNPYFATGLVGTNANFTDFPNAKFIGSQANTGSAHVYNIGVAGEGVATDVAGAGQWGVGVYGTGATTGATRGIGVVGDGHVSNTADTAAAIGVRGYATGAHAGGQNIGSSNYSLFMASGNIYSAVTQTWAVPDNEAVALSIDTTGKAGILKIITTDSAEGISTSGKLDVAGVATLGAGAVLNTPASATLTNATGLPLTTGVTGTLPIANGGTGQTTATTAFNALAPSQATNSGKYLTTDGTNSSWATVDSLPSQATNSGKYLTTDGTTPSWATVNSGASISNDTSTSTNVYPLFASVTTGVPTVLYTGNSKLLYKPSTGELQSTVLNASNGIVVTASTVNADYTIASGFNGMSAGPISIASGVSVTIANDSVWTIV